MTNRPNLSRLARWTAALLAISTAFFALSVLMERSGESRETPAASEPLEAGESAEENEQAEGSHAEGAGTEAGGEESETILGINLENPWIVWGFVGISLLLAVAVLRFGRTALLFTILLAGAAALMDAREVFFQFGRANMLIAVLAFLTALAHAAAAILALKAWRALAAASLSAPNKQ